MRDRRIQRTRTLCPELSGRAGGQNATIDCVPVSLVSWKVPTGAGTVAIS